MITDESLIFSKKNYKSFPEMEEYLKSYKAKEDEEIEVFEYKKIIEFKYFEDGSSFAVKRIDYIKKDFSLKASTEDVEALKLIEDKLKREFNLSKSQINSGRWKSIKKHTLNFTFSLFISSFFFWIACLMHNGEQIEVSKGKNYGMRKFFMAVVDFIGPYGVLLIGLGICSLYGYRIYKNFNKPIILNVLKK
jgi:hypothetical protein